MEKQKIWAILIGIDFYRAEIQLKGAVNDVEIMKSYFSGAKQGSINLSTFTASNPKKSNAQNPPEEASAWPTYDNVTSRVKEISRDASPGDLFYIHYSGHGTRQSTASAEYSEHNSSDIALVLFDEEQDARYLRGLDLARLLEDMVKKRVKVAIVLDCCYSGGVTRGDSCIRGLDWDDGVDANYPLPEAMESAEQSISLAANRDAFWTFDWLQDPRGFTLLTACGPHEVAVELQLRDTNRTWHGSLTYFLVSSLQRIQKGGLQVSYQSLYSLLYTRFRAERPQQSPMLLGNRDVSFLGDFLPPTTEYIGVSVKSDGTLCLHNGRAHGVCENDEYEIYQYALPDRDQSSHDSSMIKARVVAVEPLTSDLAEIQTRGNSSSIRTGSMARPVARFSTKPVYIRLNVPVNRDDDMLSALEDSNFLRSSTDHVNRQELCSYQIDRNESHYKIFDDSYEKLQNVPSISIREKKPEISVVNILEHIVKYKLIESLENQTPAPILERSFQISFTDSSDTELDPAGAMEIQDNGKLNIKFHNTSQMPLFLSLHCLNPLWQIDSIYRAGGGPDYYVIQPEDVSLNHTGKRKVTITMRIPEELKRSGRRRCDDVLKVFVTTKGTSFATLRLGKLPGCDQEEAMRGHSTQLSSFLDSLAAPRRGRVDDARARENEWATRNFVVRTVNQS